MSTEPTLLTKLIAVAAEMRKQIDELDDLLGDERDIAAQTAITELFEQVIAHMNDTDNKTRCSITVECVSRLGEALYDLLPESEASNGE